MKRLALIGGGGHCKSCIEVINSTSRFNIIGIFDKQEKKSENYLGVPYLGDDSKISDTLSANDMALITVGQIHTSTIRKKLYELTKSMKIQMPVVIASSSIVSHHSKILEGSIIMHGAIVNAAAKIGSNVIINSMALIEHDVQIGDHSHISTGARINGNVHIAEGCFIGSGAIIHHGIQIGSNAVIGAGAVIDKDIASSSIVRGPNE